MRNFSGKVAAITGAGSGIGRALATALAARGCHLALSDIHADNLRTCAAEAERHGVKVSTKVLDVADRAAFHEWADATVAEHGKVNLLFNNAGVALVTTIEDADYADLEWIMGINFWGVVHGTKAFLPHLKASGEGHIVNLSSLFGIMAIPGQCGYNAAKFAVRGYTECLREELDILKCGVSATCVHPGGIKTNIARAARNDGTVEKLGMEVDPSGELFDQLARLTPEQAARVILRGVKRNQRRVIIGADAKLLDWLVRQFPSGYQRAVVRLTSRLGNVRR